MNRNIIYRAPNEEITKEKIDKINLELEEFEKETRHRILLEQSFFISLFVVILTIILELIDYLFGVTQEDQKEILSTRIQSGGLKFFISPPL